MRIAFIAATGLVGLYIAYGRPFFVGLRGGSVLKTIGIAWARLVVFMTLLCLVAPMSVGFFSEKLGHEMFTNWVPEMPAIIAALVIGWLPPLLALSVGSLVRAGLGSFWPRALSRIDALDKTDETETCFREP
jgi:hypothetical protein